MVLVLVLVCVCVCTVYCNFVNRNVFWVNLFVAGCGEGELWLADEAHTANSDFDVVSLDELISGFVHFYQ